MDISDEVKFFISTHLSVPLKKIKDNASLFHDLGVDGDDAQEFMVEYSRKFDVDIDGINFEQYFGDESSGNPLSFLTELFTKSSYKDLKRLEVMDLIKAVESKKLIG